MIFNWEKEFSEDMILEGIDFEDEISYLDRSISTVSGCVKDNDDEYWVYVELDDNFEIESIECDCGESRCCHMTALLNAENSEFTQYIEYEEFIDKLDSGKLIEFIKDQISYNEECQEDFIDEFRLDFLKKEDFPLDHKLYLILDYYNWQSLITDYVKNDLIALYEDGCYDETFYIISALFSKVLDDVTFNPETELNECYSIIIDLIKKLSAHKPELVKQFLEHCINHNYLEIYPPFRKLDPI